MNEWAAVVMGASAGGRGALAEILSRLPASFNLPILVAQHLSADDVGGFSNSLQCDTLLRVVTPCDKQAIAPGTVYLAPANYHMLCDRSGHIALTVDEKVHWSRPSIDVLFESAVRAWQAQHIIAVLLSGANSDGAAGLKTIRDGGGLTLVQDPDTAKFPVMPRSALDLDAACEILTTHQIGDRLLAEGGIHE